MTSDRATGDSPRAAPSRRQRPHRLLLSSCVLAALTATTLIGQGAGASPPAAGLHSSMPATRPAATSGPAGSYVNPVSDSAVAEFPDPSTIRGKDGYW